MTYQQKNVEMKPEDFDERYISYSVMCNEVEIKFVSDTDGVLDSFELNDASFVLDAKDDIKLPYEGEFQTIDYIFNHTINDAIE
jgi:hypothetical protein